MPEKQISRKKIQQLPEKVHPLSLILSLLFSLSVFYSYLFTYYELAAEQMNLLIACGILGAVLCLLFMLKNKSWVFIPLAALLVGFILLIFREELVVACRDITESFVEAYNSYMYVPLKISYIQFYEMEGFLCLFLLVHFWVLLWNVRWKLPLVSALPALGLLAMGVVTDVFPTFLCTLLMTAFFFGLLSLKSTKSWGYSLGITAAAALAAVVINFTLLPLYNQFTAAYSRPLIDTQSKIIEGIKGGNTDKLMADFLTGGGKESTLNDEEIDQKGKIMLTVTDHGSTARDIYLRGFTGTEYTGFSWVASKENEFEYFLKENKLGSKAVFEAQVSNDSYHQVTVKYVGDETDYVYTPYFSFLPENAEIVADSYLAKSDTDKDYYDILVDDTPGGDKAILQKYEKWVYEKYLDLGPLEDSEILAEIAGGYRTPEVVSSSRPQGVLPELNDDSVGEKLGYIYGILDSYRYTETPPATPKGEDYIEYFLGSSKEGYCQHFASAAVMLCRYMGIPARYVTGYAIPSENFVETSFGWYYSVPDHLSHAWFEVYIDDIGWVKYDFTPASALANPNLAGPGNGTGGAGGEGDEPGMNSPEVPYNHFNYDPEEEFVIPEDNDYIIAITLDFFDFVPIIIALVIVTAVVIIVWHRMSSKFEFYRVGRFDFSSDESRRLAIDRSFRALEFCVPSRSTDDDYSYMDYALGKFLDEEEIKLYKAVVQENSYGSGWSFDEKEVIALMGKLRKGLIYSLKPVKQFIFLYILCY